MSKSWREPNKGIWGKGKGTDKRRETARKEEEKARKEIQKLARRTGERVETFFD